MIKRAAFALVLGLSQVGAVPVISEVMFHPPHRDPRTGGENPQEEWIEIHNRGFGSANLAGWTLEGVGFTFPNVSIPEGGFLVIAANEAAFRAQHPNVLNLIGGWNGRLSNRGESLRLLNHTGAEIDRVDYADSGDWARRRPGSDDRGHTGWIWDNPADGGGRTLEVRNLHSRNDLGQNWTFSAVEGGTPGAPNSVRQVNVAPFIEDVSHHPAVPGPRDLVLVRARLSDDLSSPIRGVVHHRVSSLAPTPFASTVMRDDGTGGDEVAHDNIYTAVLPAQPEGATVEFYLEAFDRIQSRTWPAAAHENGLQEANLLYQVDSEQPAGEAPFYRFILSAGELEEFLKIPFDSPERDTNARFNATFIANVDGKTITRYQCALRLRGSGTRSRYPRNLKIELPSSTPWKGRDELNLNVQFSYNQLLGSMFYRAAGLPAYESRAVAVRLNGVNHASPENASVSRPFNHHFGLYVQNEPINNRYVREHYPLETGGNLYRMTGNGTGWDYFPGSNDLEADYRGSGWDKENNDSLNDWSDLHSFIGVMSTATGENYLKQIRRVMDVESWLRNLAVSTILTNGENSIFTGRDDDYAMYCGIDGRFKLIPHDLDTILGAGDGSRIGIANLPHTILDFVERGESFLQLQKLFREPEVLQRYYQILRELLVGPFEQSSANRLIDDALTWTPRGIAEAAKEFLAARRADILSVIERPLCISSNLETTRGLPTSFTVNAALQGTFNAGRATHVLINGEQATLEGAPGTWAYDFKGLAPGINRITVEEQDADGNIVASAYMDILYDDGNVSELQGDLTNDTVLDAAGGPWLISESLNILPGVTLTIEPGTSVFFQPDAGIMVHPGGALKCEGTRYRRIRLSNNPGSTDIWQGIRIEAPSGQESLAENVISFTDMEHGDGQGESIELRRSRLLLDHVSWDHCNDTILEVYSPQLEVRDCVFPPVSESEALKGSTLRGNDFLVLHRNVFNPSPNYNDIIRFSGAQRPGPVLAAYDNIFNGATDECFDLNNCDAHLEGNVFMNVRLSTPRNSTANAVAINYESSVTLTRNLFHNVDHAVLAKNGADCQFENNTVVNATIAAINLNEPLRPNTLPADSVDLESNIFLECNAIFAYPEEVEVTGSRNILPEDDHWIGDGNLALNPFLYNLAGGPLPRDNWKPLPDSPAIGSGKAGRDRGAIVPAGATVSGLPSPLTHLDSMTLSVNGAGVTDYRFRLVTNGNTGGWSPILSVETPVQLRGLEPGTYRVDLLARDSAGHWQDELDPTSSREWQVVSSIQSSALLNEVEAVARPAEDRVELFNPREQSVSLEGWFLSDNPSNPTKIALSGILAPGAYLSLSGDEVPSLSPSGDQLLLYYDGNLVDSIRWGTQAPGNSIGRHGPERIWTLCAPTPDSENQSTGLTPSRFLRINEWLTDPAVRYTGEFVELFNPGDSPMHVGGIWLSNRPDYPKRHQLPAHSYIPPGGFLVLYSTDDRYPQADEFPFRLNGFRQWLMLTSEEGILIDRVSLRAQAPDLVEGRNPDGSSEVESLPFGTPGRSNNRAARVEQVSTLLPFQHSAWRFLDNRDPGAEWISPDFADNEWETGPAPLGRETSALTVPLATTGESAPAFDYRRGRKNYYFRTVFEFDGDPSRTLLSLATYVDDGAIFYLNGHEILRHNVPEGELNEDTWARETITNASLEGPFPVPSSSLLVGTNTLAVVTYQASATSSDIVFDCELAASVSTPGPPDPSESALQILLDHLRITEVMYNPPDGSAGEFIEVQNTSYDLPLNLEGVRFTAGIEFTFPSLILEPRAHAVIVKDPKFFELIHGADINIAGTFEDGKLHNDGEAIALTLPEPVDAHIQKFTYDHAWHPATDSTGFSLELRDPDRELETWNQRSAWMPSFARHGSPGFPNGASSYQSWASALDVHTGDSDGDLLDNAFEYAFGFDPSAKQSIPLLLEQLIPPSGGLTTTYHAPAVAPEDVILSIESSSDLKNWTTEAIRIANGSWNGEGSLQSTSSAEGLSIIRLHLPPGRTRFTRMKVDIFDPEAP